MTDTRQRKSPGEWKPLILKAALLAARAGLSAVTLRGVARSCHISHKQVALSFGSVEALRDAVAAEALKVKDADVIGRMIIDKHRLVDSMPVSERAEYVAALAD